MIDTDAIIDRVKGKAASAADEEVTAEADPMAAETGADTADAHLGEAFDAFKAGDRAGFVAAMKACLASGYNPV